MRVLSILSAIALAVLFAAGCSGISGNSTSRPGGSPDARTITSATTNAASGVVFVGGYVRGDDDSDGTGARDEDDRSIREYGHEATAADKQAIMALVKRYYELATSGKGGEACSMLDAKLARRSNFRTAVPQDYVPALGSSVFRGKGCAGVASLLFQADHQRLVADLRMVKVVSFRVDGSHGLALLAFRTAPEREIAVEREHGAWRIDAFLDSELP
jgi:hypothetical protein